MFPSGELKIYLIYRKKSNTQRCSLKVSGFSYLIHLNCCTSEIFSFVGKGTEQLIFTILLGFAGVAAMGKTYALAAFANDWAQEGTPNKMDAMQSARIKSFDLIFLLRLRNITSNAPLEAIIADQHELSKEQGKQLKNILDGTVKYKILFCFDGYDEYTPGTNEAIDQAISTPCANYSILVTSRPGQYVSKRITEQMSCQVQLEGYSDEEIGICTVNYLGNAVEAQKLINNMKIKGLYDLLKIPVFLLMLLQLHGKLDASPKSKTEVFWQIVQMCIERSVRRHFGKTVKEMEDLDEMLNVLGQLSWDAIQKDTANLILNKVSIFCYFYFNS